MEKIDKTTVEHIAKLARLSFSDEDKKKISLQLNDILTYVEKLNELDTDDVQPMSQVVSVNNVTRDDKSRPSAPVDAVLKNAPDPSGNLFRVPRIIG